MPKAGQLHSSLPARPPACLPVCLPFHLPYAAIALASKLHTPNRAPSPAAHPCASVTLSCLCFQAQAACGSRAHAAAEPRCAPLGCGRGCSLGGPGGLHPALLIADCMPDGCGLALCGPLAGTSWSKALWDPAAIPAVSPPFVAAAVVQRGDLRDRDHKATVLQGYLCSIFFSTAVCR